MHRQSTILILAMCAAAAQSDLNFTVAGTPVRIGEDRETVLSRLRQSYEVRSSGTDSYLIAEKNAPALKKVGEVTFESGKLASAGTTWGETFGSDGVRFAKALVGAIGNQEISGARTVILRPLQNNGSAGFELLIGDRTIDVLTSQATPDGKAPAQYATVMETLHNGAYVTAVQRSASSR